MQPYVEYLVSCVTLLHFSSLSKSLEHLDVFLSKHQTRWDTIR